MSTRRGSSTQVASSVPFNNAGSSIRNQNLQSVLAEFRKQTVTDPEFLTSSLNGTATLTSSSNSLQIVDGTATGYSVNLPDATTLFEGAFYEISNTSNQTISIKNNSGGSLGSLNQNDVVFATLKDNSTANGTWILLIISTIASGVNAFNVTTNSVFSTTSSTDVALTSMSLTPNSGTYGVWFSSDVTIGTNNRIAQAVIYKDTTAIENTRRDIQGVSSNFVGGINLLGIIQVNGSESINVRVNISGGSVDFNQRSLLVIRLGQ